MSINIELLESSFNLVALRADEMINLFYRRLFSEHPELRPMFPDDMGEQEKHLADALSTIVGYLSDPELLKGYVSELGLRHIDYGVQREHYAIVGQTLLTTLAEVAGDAWTDEMYNAWADAYKSLQDIIFQALDEHRPAA